MAEQKRWRSVAAIAVLMAGVVYAAPALVEADQTAGDDPPAETVDGGTDTNDATSNEGVDGGTPDGSTEPDGGDSSGVQESAPIVSDDLGDETNDEAGQEVPGPDTADTTVDDAPIPQDDEAQPEQQTTASVGDPIDEGGPDDPVQDPPEQQDAAPATGAVAADGTNDGDATDDATDGPDGGDQHVAASPEPAAASLAAEDDATSGELTETSAEPESQDAGSAGDDAPLDTDDAPAEPTSSTSAEQDTDVVGTQVAVSNTGRNVAVGNGTATTTGGSLSISSGSATAVGNDEQTEITQEAVTELSGQATAEIIQISIVFNIGGAFASSGSNAASNDGGGSGSSTSTGSAVAIGNDSETYLTQAGTADAGAGHVDTIDQRVLTLQIGVAVSDSGNNTIVATVSDGAGGPATIASGDATAIGNQSDTSIEQIAQVVGSGHAELSVEQWATVVNLGVALANTGANQVGDMFAALLDNPDSAEIRELFEVLLPALLADPGASAPDATPDALEASTSEGSLAAGDIDTGEAIAIGNRSTTHVQQVAVAVASGDGRTDVRQEVVAVNAGAAGANSGGNRTGAPLTGPTPALAPAVQAVVDELSNHVAGILRQITDWANGSDTDITDTALSTRVGGHLIGLEGFLSTSTGTREVGGGLMATIRQLSAVFNLGVAIADTGRNVMISVEGVPARPPAVPNIAMALDDPDPAASDALSAVAGQDPSDEAVTAADVLGTDVIPPALAAAMSAEPVMAALEVTERIFTIVTGDASARNSSLVVVCQRVNSPHHECLGPPDPPAGGPDEPGPLPDDSEPPTGADDDVTEPSEPDVAVAPPVPEPEQAAPPAVRIATPEPGAPAAPPGPATPPVRQALPDTGAESNMIIVVGLLLLGLGAVLTTLGRRRSV